MPHRQDQDRPNCNTNSAQPTRSHRMYQRWYHVIIVLCCIFARGHQPNSNSGIAENEITIIRKNCNLLKIIDNLQATVAIVEAVDESFGKKSQYLLKHCSQTQILLENQHSVELWIPHSLRHHKFNKLLISGANKNITRLPLFYFVEAHPFVALICSNPGTEDWDSFYTYWKHVMEHITRTSTWKANNGLNYLIPASHPLLPAPSMVGPDDHVKNSFAHASFLTTDNDGHGKRLRDIIVPYRADVDERSDAVSFDDRPITLFLACPALQYTRITVLQRLQNLVDSDIQVVNVTAKYLPLWEYLSYMHNAKFCMHVRGDTVSSKRLFSSINAGCVPVLVSDWLELPYERFIDYSLFTIAVPEADVYERPASVVQLLRQISPARLISMQHHLMLAKKILMYDSLESGAINPVSLMLAEAVMVRADYCRRRQLWGTGHLFMCNMLRDIVG